jgi:hypothetical protein
MTESGSMKPRGDAICDTPSSTKDTNGDCPAARRPKVLFALAHIGFYRNFERTILDLTARGAEVVVAVSKKHKAIKLEDYQSINHPHIRFAKTSYDEGFATRLAAGLRVYRDAIFYTRPEFHSAAGLVDRFISHQKGYISQKSFNRILATFQRAPNWLRRLADRLVGGVDRVLPPHPKAERLLAERAPDVVVVSPLVHFHSKEVEVLKAARRRGITSILAVASWDNLTNKGIMKAAPELVAVWNEPMAEEAVRLHGINRSSILVTGAPVFDWWFDKGARLSRLDFLSLVTIPDDHRHRRVIVYLCSSVSIVNGSEVALFNDWLAAIRGSSDPNVSEAVVIVRPHPMAVAQWADAIERQDAGQRADYTLFPRVLSHPTSDEQKSSFLNTLLHADAIVGLNTSAMIEATILGRPVLTFRGHAAEKTQSANLHFRHLAESGCVRVAKDRAEHVAQLVEVLADPSAAARSCEEFVRRFIRPRGVELEASKLLSDIIARRAGLGPRRAEDC